MDSIEELYQAAVELVNMRYPSGWGGAAAIRTESRQNINKRCS